MFDISRQATTPYSVTKARLLTWRDFSSDVKVMHLPHVFDLIPITTKTHTNGMTNNPPQRHRGENVAVLWKTRKMRFPKPLIPAWNGDLCTPIYRDVVPWCRLTDSRMRRWTKLFSLWGQVCRLYLALMFGDDVLTVLMVLEWCGGDGRWCLVPSKIIPSCQR